MLKGIKLLREVKADVVEIFRDSLLVINQLSGKYDCNNEILRVYLEECLDLLRDFKMASVEHIPKLHNEEANKLAHNASGYQTISDVIMVEPLAGDWRKEIVEYLKDPSQKVSRQLRFRATKFV